MDIIKTIFVQLGKLRINGKRKKEDAKWLCLGFMFAKVRLTSNGSKLEREFGHALDDLGNYKCHNDRRDSFNAQYDNEEERRVIEGSEAETARKLRQGVRFDHWGKTYPVKDPRFTK